MIEITDKSLLYFADPMCSWCWGFSPVIHKVRDNFADLEIQMFMGGLNPGATKALDEASMQEIRQHWQHVQKATGQVVNFEFFQRKGFIYDTEPASRAVVACFRQDNAKALDFLSYLQQSFYQFNRDITSAAELVQLANEFGLDDTEFSRLSQDPETSRITQLNFAYARHLKVGGFPTLIGQTSNAHTVITQGYQEYPQIVQNLNAWLGQSA
jgi:putative protein-disulfide isomerase